MDPGRSFAWQYSLLGVRFVFHHIVGTVGGRTVATLRADIHGPLAWLGAFASPIPKFTSRRPLAAISLMLEREAVPTPGSGRAWEPL